jgi:hypothetical protein
MPAGTSHPAHEPNTSERLAQLEARLARLEEYVGAGSRGWAPAEAGAERRGTAREGLAHPGSRSEEDFEFEVGQNWFARVGILALAAGGGFMLTLPYPSLPAAAPTFVGWAVAVALLLLAEVSAPWLALVSNYVRGAGMALLYCATLRLFLFGATHALTADGWLCRALLLLAVAVNFAIALRCRSQWLTGLALATGCISAVVIGSPWFALVVIVLLSLLSVAASTYQRWPAVLLAGMVMTFGTYLAWAVLANRGGTGRLLVSEPALAPAFLLLTALVFGAAPLLRHSDQSADPITNVCAFANCVLGYGIFLLHTATAFQNVFAPAHAAASVLFLGLAVVYRNRHHSHVSTFFFAMTGYAALSMAIIKLSAAPDVFVWLSLQSVLVVATAVWFGSRFIVVANFLIFALVVAAYILVQQRETGISIGFGIVALISARLLNWQQHRLELKTDLMRNAYLLSAFFVFPYALYHLVAGRYLALAWVALALVYYALNLIVRSQKYRWMGHATLVLTTIYVVIVASSRLDPIYRVLSFLTLGTALLIVSLSFTRARRQQPRGAIAEAAARSPANADSTAP